jgi:TRAP-type mannitol/chloroaromatic compound transport system permease large subunit
VWPFILLQLVALGMVIALPEIAMWLPAHTQ